MPPEARLRLVRSDPKRAEQLGRTYRDSFPDGARSDEADALLVYALYNQRRMYDAKIAAIYYYRQHPNGEYTIKLVKLTRTVPPSIQDEPRGPDQR